MQRPGSAIKRQQNQVAAQLKGAQVILLESPNSLKMK